MSLRDEFPSDVANDLGEGVYRIGLQALEKAGRDRVGLSRSRDCHGSANIDAALVASRPNDPRWDYVVAYDETLHFIEVHPAHTSAVEEMRRKLEWLKGWLDGKALERPGSSEFHWVASGKIAILPNSRQMRQAARMRLKPKKYLQL
ncbi:MULTISPECIES: hypothetical protein [unclassified Thioalkalivibrio]|uniref:hypothetical protein n=1 Tax=unclassified Thioalkalivibrio TaxID=2621013 RepID=UPI0003715E78|nr:MULTISPECIES: hypothetical protein [unclassified Thioalkalivibrio]